MNEPTSKFPHMGRPYTVFTPELVEALRAEYQAKRFNMSQRARELGVKQPALAYHMRGGKAGRR